MMMSDFWFWSFLGHMKLSFNDFVKINVVFFKSLILKFVLYISMQKFRRKTKKSSGSEKKLYRCGCKDL